MRGTAAATVGLSRCGRSPGHRRTTDLRSEHALRNPPAVVLVFVRAPEAGRVKTRLAASIGPLSALRVYRRLAEHAVQEALALASATVRVYFTPPDRGEEVARWLGPGPAFRPQAPGGLGDRLARAFQEAFSDGFERVLVIGSDLPDLSTRHLARALELLDRSPAVLGPARDGGYWLLGLRSPRPEIFVDVEWSTDCVLEQTITRLLAAGLEPALLEELSDVDEATDLPDEWAAWPAAPGRRIAQP